MKLLFKQRFFSWFDSYDIYFEDGSVAFRVEGKLAWGHKLHILDRDGNHIATVKEEVITLLPRFKLFVGDELIGRVRKKFTFFKPSFILDFNGWRVDGNFFEWNYSVCDASGNLVATVDKKLFNLTDTYVIEVADPENSLYALMVTLAIDAAKCSSGNG